MVFIVMKCACIAAGVETVAFSDRFIAEFMGLFKTDEGGRRHQQRRLGKVKVSKQAANTQGKKRGSLCRVKTGKEDHFQRGCVLLANPLF